MTQPMPVKRWLTIAEAAQVARRTDRTIRNWVRDGVLRPAARGMFDRDAVLAAEKRMKNRRGRPLPSAPRVLSVAPETWVEVTACGTHSDALDAGMIALTCLKCRIRPAERPATGGTTNHEVERQS